jgi:peptidoglycan/LPS O-acetylase OafA/YrhL
VVESAERRIPSLDGLRGISIALVLLGHLAGTAGFPLSEGSGSFSAISALGVRVFFVISGFLITGLLLEEMRRHGRVRIGRFYFRRTLRIFPPYYVFLAVTFAASALGAFTLASGDVAHTLTYTSNYHEGRSWYVGHTWSLSVEEQFYLLWPAVLLLAGVKRGILIAAAVVLISPAIRLFEWHFVPWAAAGVGTRFETVADTIAVGCVLAGSRGWLHHSRLYMRALGSVAFMLVPMLALAGGLLTDYPQASFALGMSVSNVAVALCIDWAVTFHDGRVGRVLNAMPLMFVGWISYSLYLWQQLFLNRASDALVNSFPLNLALAGAAAVASYVIVERPSLNVRRQLEARFFGPRPAPRPPQDIVAPAA